MSVVAVINLCLVFVSLLLAKKEGGKISYGIKISLTFISVFTLIIIATAISKMVLYYIFLSLSFYIFLLHDVIDEFAVDDGSDCSTFNFPAVIGSITREAHKFA